MKTIWQKIKFEDCLKKTVQPKGIKQKFFRERGTFPVVDQGVKDIAGYTDDNKNLFKGNLPVIIFGDHTRVIKFVDFPFVLGADGTKVITPNDNFEVKYFYYYLQSVNLQSRGYNRHYKLLRELLITCPPKPTQQKIVKVLDGIQAEIGKQREIIEKTKELKKSLMKKLFREGTRGEKLKETEIGKMPESWEIKKIGDLGVIVTGSTPGTGQKQFYGGEYKLISPADLNDKRYIETAHKLLTEEGLNTCRVLPKNSILVSCIGEIGKMGMTIDEKSASNQQINAIICDKKNDPNFVYYLLSFRKQDLQKYAAKVTIPIINKNNFSKIVIPFCRDIAEQKEIASILEKVDERIEVAQKQKKLYEELFNITLNKLMGGEIDIEKIKI